MRIQIIFDVITYSINKFVEFNNTITSKLIIKNKHIYEILDQDIDVNILFKEK